MKLKIKLGKAFFIFRINEILKKIYIFYPKFDEFELINEVNFLKVRLFLEIF